MYTTKEHFHTRDMQVGFSVVLSFSKITGGTGSFMLFFLIVRVFYCEMETEDETNDMSFIFCFEESEMCNHTCHTFGRECSSLGEVAQNIMF